MILSMQNQTSNISSNYNSTYVDDSEDFLIKFFNKPQSRKVESIITLLQNNPDWPILYHLSPQRELLLNWYPFNTKANLLEIGAGCGALTGLFAQKVRKVYANELTNKRMEIISKRYSDCSNIVVLPGNIAEQKIDELFDYITIIGVLEYAGRFFSITQNDFFTPYLMFLKNVRKMLKPNGKVIIAIENKLGLKYIAGGKEDHYGNLFSSIENYPNFSGIRTFSKNELIHLIRAGGFSKINFFYPFPDYKLPTIIFSDKFLKQGLNLPKSYYAQIIDNAHQRLFLFNEVIFAESLFQERILDRFANSFLVEVGV